MQLEAPEEMDSAPNAGSDPVPSSHGKLLGLDNDTEQFVWDVEPPSPAFWRQWSHRTAAGQSDATSVNAHFLQFKLCF